MMNTKNGMPISVVIAPIGIEMSAMFISSLIRRSAADSSSAPMTMDAGKSRRWSPPSSILARCGTISPTNPMMPTNDTQTAVRRDATSMETSLNLS